VSEIRREINKRGQGGRLRREILDAAIVLLGRVGTDDGVTLRAIARQAGIAAPSVYPHFADRAAIIDAVVAESFAELVATTHAAKGSPADRLRAICVGYVRFGRDQPGRYRILFEGSHEGAPQSVARRRATDGGAAFAGLTAALAECVADGSSASADPARDSAALWVALHGLVVLPRANPAFGWPATEVLLDHIVTSLGRLTGTGTIIRSGREPVAGRQSRPASTVTESH
jgi:AcrR family transcriptional regulator